jgi:hypothetical protein
VGAAAPSLPYVKWPDAPFLRYWEGKATELRCYLKLSDDEPLDPFALFRIMPDIVVIGSAELAISCPLQYEALQPHRGAWSAAAYREDGGKWLVLYNSAHARTRTNVSLLEELAHIYLGHQPSNVFVDEKGMCRRTYAKSKEKEAYGVAAATLVPFAALVRRITRGLKMAEIGEYFGASESLIKYRVQTTQAQERAKRLRRI